MTRKEKLLGMIDTRMEELIEIESYELCAKLRDWRKEVVASKEEPQEAYIPKTQDTITTPAKIKITSRGIINKRKK